MVEKVKELQPVFERAIEITNSNLIDNGVNLHISIPSGMAGQFCHWHPRGVLIVSSLYWLVGHRLKGGYRGVCPTPTDTLEYCMCSLKIQMHTNAHPPQQMDLYNL